MFIWATAGAYEHKDGIWHCDCPSKWFSLAWQHVILTHLPAPIISYADSKQLQGEAKPAPPNTGGYTEHGIRLSPPMSFVKKHVLQIVNNFLKIQPRDSQGALVVFLDLRYLLRYWGDLLRSLHFNQSFASRWLSEHEAISEHWIWKLW